jgi:phage terminase large subunit GpA-like protein
LSKNPPPKLDIITSKHRKKQIKYMLKEIKKFPKRNVSEDLVTFSERKRRLVSGTSARSGPYRFSNAPMWREVAYEMSESSKTTEGVVMAATQTGKTENMLNHELYCIEYGIGPMCYVSSDEGLAEKHSETRFGPMLQAAGMQSYIQAPVKSRANKGTGDKVNLKFYKGTFIQFIGARSESKASSTPIRILHIDEIDKFPLQLSGGGNPIIKLLRRTDSYDKLKKIFYVSTPKRKATSQIEPLYEQGDMRKYHIECQGCKELHILEWARIKWDKDENGRVLLEYDENDDMINDPVWHECPHCGYKMRCHEKVVAMKEEEHGGHAKWIPSKKPDRPGIKSWHVSGLYGFRSWLDIVMEFQDAKDDKILLEDFICDTLAETWEDSIDKPDEHYLMARAETDWERGQVPDEVKILSLGCDIQENRIEYGIIGWARNKESWFIDYDTFDGDPFNVDDELWDKLYDVLTKEYEKISGEKIRIQIAFLDAQGKAARAVKAFCEKFPYHPSVIGGVFPALGKANMQGTVKEHESTINTPEVLLNDQKLKAEIYGILKLKVPATGHKYPWGFMHFPGGETGFNADFYKQMTAEEVEVIMNTKGTASEFIIHNKKQRRNEVLDVAKMQLGALYYMYVTYFKRTNAHRKARKKRELPADWRLFWSLYGDDGSDDVEE